jgi:hypothetical protein
VAMHTSAAAANASPQGPLLRAQVTAPVNY